MQSIRTIQPAADSITHGKILSSRLLSLDAFRGATVAGMVLVNNPGTWSAIYPPLEHADWHGMTPTDLIFPFFLFISGVSLAFSLGRTAEQGQDKGRTLLKITRRSIILFLVGLIIHALPNLSWTTFRIPGVLQRIAICYFFASIIFLTTKARTQIAIIVGLLLGYWLLMVFIPSPGFAAGDLTKEGNLAGYIDRIILRGHIYQQSKFYDPEGILSTIPSLATMLLGVITGQRLRRGGTGLNQVYALIGWGVGGVALGLVWSLWFPLNKSLWTSSYVLVTAGIALVLLAGFYWLIDIKLYQKWAKPFVALGMNALAIYALSELLSLLLEMWPLRQADGTVISLQGYIFDHIFAPWAEPVVASLCFALCDVLLMVGIAMLMYRKRVFIKI